MRGARLKEVLADGRPAILVLLVSLVAGILLGSVFDGGGGVKVVTVNARIGPSTTAGVPARSSRSAATRVASSSHAALARERGAPSAWQAGLQTALNRGVQEAEDYGGSAAGAVWVDGWASPIDAGAADRHDRMWSVSKPVTAVAVLEAAQSRGTSPSAGAVQAMTDAITRSDNCAQRRVELELERLTESTGVSSYLNVLARAGVEPTQTVEVVPLAADEQDCIPYLRQTAAQDATAPAPQFGTFFWTVDDAVRFAYALGRGTYGSAGAQVLDLMRRPKEHGLQPTWREDYTAPLDTPPSGGTFPTIWRPAYKGGWGGSADGDFSASQIIVLNVADHMVAIAGRFWPDHQPSSDNPGDTRAPEALGALFTSLEDELIQLPATSRG